MLQDNLSNNDITIKEEPHDIVSDNDCVSEYYCMASLKNRGQLKHKDYYKLNSCIIGFYRN